MTPRVLRLGDGRARVNLRRLGGVVVLGLGFLALWPPDDAGAGDG
jgi:hypothetical protein